MNYDGVKVVHFKNTLKEGHNNIDFIEFLRDCDFTNYLGFRDGARLHETELVQNWEYIEKK